LSHGGRPGGSEKSHVLFEMPLIQREKRKKYVEHEKALFKKGKKEKKDYQN